MSAAAHGRNLVDTLRERVDRPEAVLIALLLAAAIALAWFSDGLLVAVGVALALSIGGFGSVWVMGPARPGLGFARYVTLPLAAVAMILGGRLLAGGLLILLVPMAGVLSWSVLWLELHLAERRPAQWALELILVAIFFGLAAGLLRLFAADAWPPPMALVALLAFVLGLRLAEGRGEGGLASIGHGGLHALVVAQVGAAVVLLDLAAAIGPALMALAFYVWGGTVDALQRGASLRSVIIEFGSLTVLGLVWALLLYQR
jgi:hypothetical protein